MEGSAPMTLASGPVEGDAFGQALLARHEGRAGDMVAERDDGLIELDGFDYFALPHGPLWDWVVARLGQRVLDVGAGAGRAALALQATGTQVTALDVSPGAVEVCRRRGVASTFLGTVQDLAATHPAPFDSFLLLNSLSYVFGASDPSGFLDALKAMGGPEAAVVGTIRDPRCTTHPAHVEYHAANRAAGRMIGEVRWRMRCQRLADPFHTIVWASREELAEMANRFGWRLEETTPPGNEPGVNVGAVYGAVLRPSSMG